jgi:hypothetical protein
MSGKPASEGRGKLAAQRVFRALIALAHGQPSTDVTNAELIAWTGVRERCIQLGLADLERRGLISRYRRIVGGRRIITLHRFAGQAGGKRGGQ